MHYICIVNRQTHLCVDQNNQNCKYKHKIMSKEYLKSKFSPTETIISLKMNVPTPIRNRDIKTGTIKSTISRLRKKGYIIEYTEEGRVDDILVTLKKVPL